MLNLSCHCGRIRLALKKRPDYINECNCTLCSKSGARWGYFDPSDVAVEGTAATYCREDKGDPVVQLHSCATCGSTTHWTLTSDGVAKFGNTRMGVNMRLADEKQLTGIELRFPDGRAWSGEGGFGYISEPRIIGR